VKGPNERDVNLLIYMYIYISILAHTVYYNHKSLSHRNEMKQMDTYIEIVRAWLDPIVDPHREQLLRIYTYTYDKSYGLERWLRLTKNPSLSPAVRKIDL